MTVRGYLVSDDFEDADSAFPDETLAELERGFLRVARHTDCAVCHGSQWASAAMCWPRNGFSEFPLNFRPRVVQTVQGV